MTSFDKKRKQLLSIAQKIDAFREFTYKCAHISDFSDGDLSDENTTRGNTSRKDARKNNSSKGKASKSRVHRRKCAQPACFSLLYTSRDERYCLYETREGHLVSANADKFV